MTKAWVLLAVAAFAPSPAPSDLARLLAKLDAYLDKYESELSAVVADEDLIQETEGRFDSKKRRHLQSDFAFIRLPGANEWLGFRHVKVIDTTAVPAGGPALAEMLAASSGDAWQQASLLVDQSAKHNLGYARTVNMPTLPLELLGRQHRHRYDIRLDGRERVKGRAMVVVEMRELGPPPIIYNGGHQLQSTVRAWIEAENGALWRAEVKMKEKGNTGNPASLRIDFAQNRTLGILVPVEMREDFRVPNGRGRGRHAYSNFRRFQTSARIVPPQ